jgi:arsenite methyltransferase
LSQATRDRWADWLLDRRFGGDASALEATLRFLAPVRDRVLDGAALSPDDTLLDVGAGDGLIAFGALERGVRGVVFSDVSDDLLDHSRDLAERLGVAERCRFVRAAAQDLAGVEDASVDVVTTRSVLIYVPLADKRRAFQEFHRVLRPGGRVSCFEPINRFGLDARLDTASFLGLDTEPVAHLAARVKAFFDDRAPGERTLVDFDERDLVGLAEAAGFRTVELDYEARIQNGTRPWGTDVSWDVFVRSSGNPCAPTLDEALDGALDADERRAFEDHVRPLFETAQGTSRSAVAYLRARKAAE